MTVVVRPLLALPFLLLPLTGCADQGKPSVRLVLISPHRDELREEVALAFTDWLQERTHARITALEAVVQQWTGNSTADNAALVDHAFNELSQDWGADNLGGVPIAYNNWHREPTVATAEQLARTIDRNKVANTSENGNPFPRVEIVWQDIGGGTSQIARYVSARFESNPSGIGIDLLFGGGTDIYLRFASQGLLEKINLPPSIFEGRIRKELNGIPLYDPEGRWYGPILSSFGILYNREVLRRIDQPGPERWADLGDPGLAGWISAGDPRITGSVHMVYEIILQGHGWEEGFRQVARLAANCHSFIRDSGTLARTVTSGEVAAAGNLDANALSAVTRDPQTMGFSLPSGETIINPDAIAVLKGAPQPGLARAFVEFTLSDAGQLLFLLRPGQPGGPRRHPLCRLSVVEELYAEYPPDVRSVGTANPFLTRSTISYNSKLGNARWDALNDLLGAVLVDAHADLASAWREILKLPVSPRRERFEHQLFAPPCSADDLMSHARGIVEFGPRVRTGTVNRWGEEARRRYRQVRAQAAAKQ
jgi:ABC-type Fe3+ transport system substrate-binding protein